MKGLLKMSAMIAFVCATFAFKADQLGSNYGITVEKSITEVSENLYLVTLKVVNGNEINGLAKYETKLPLAADYVKEVNRDKNVSFKLDGRKLKLVWMHIQKNRSYITSFQISTKKSIDKLSMDGKIFAHSEGEIFSFEESSKFIKF